MQQQPKKDENEGFQVKSKFDVKKSWSAVRNKLKSVGGLISLHKKVQDDDVEMTSLTNNFDTQNSLSETFNIKEMMDLKKQQRS